MKKKKGGNITADITQYKVTGRKIKEKKREILSNKQRKEKLRTHCKSDGKLGNMITLITRYEKRLKIMRRRAIVTE